MTWRGHHPTVKRLHGEYRDGVRVPAKEMKEVEDRLERSKTLPKYDITIKRRMERRYTNSRMIHGPASGACGDEPRTHRWYRQAKETKCGEMGGRESQHLIVPLKRGNQPEGPRRGKEVPSHEPLKGNMPGTLRPEPCPRNDDGSRGSRIHEMRNRVRVMCKPGSVGDLGGRPPRSTRPAKPTESRNQPVLQGQPWDVCEILRVVSDQR